MEKHDERLTRIAQAVADATPVDWDAEEAAAPAETATLARLRSLHVIADAYRSVPGLAPDRPALFGWRHLQVVEKLGEGTSSEVFRAFDPVLGRDIALKLWRAESSHAALRRSVDEARRLARIRHGNVVSVHGADVAGGRFGIWSDLIRGKTLEARLASEGPLNSREAALIGIELCRALAAVHAAGLVHGDVKLANVMREEGGAIILLDFGSGREIETGARGDRGASGAGATDGRAISGTPLSLAPELVRGGGEPSRATDVYALGVVLFRIVSGSYPTPARTWDELAAKHAKGERTSLRDARPDVAAAFAAVVERALAARPAERFASAGEMESALQATLGGGEAHTAPISIGASGGDARSARASAQDPSRPSRLRVRAPVLFATTLAAIALAAVVVITRGGREQREAATTTSGAAPTSPAAAPPIAGAAQLSVTTSLFRVGELGREPLASGSAIEPGDQLCAEVESNVPCHVYVLDEDESGEVYVLFPVAGLDLVNPLAAGARHRLPGLLNGAPYDWKVTSAGGRETILIVASRDPLPLVEARIAALPAAEPGGAPQYAQLDPVAVAGLRGIAALSPSDAAPAPNGARRGSQLSEIARLARDGAKDDAHIWLQAYELSNPAH